LHRVTLCTNIKSNHARAGIGALGCPCRKLDPLTNEAESDDAAA
jgi:hypothetical protein